VSRLGTAIVVLAVACVVLAVVGVATDGASIGTLLVIATVGLAIVGLTSGARRGGECGHVPPPSFGSDRHDWRCTRERRHYGTHRYHRRGEA